MKDTIIKGSGNSRSLITVPNAPMLYPTHEELMQQWATVGIPIDLGPLNEAGLEQRGIDLNKPNLLSDETEIAIWGDAQDRTPNDALAALQENIDAKQIQCASGTFSGTSTSTTLPFLPDYIVLMVEITSKSGTVGLLRGGRTIILSSGLGFTGTFYIPAMHSDNPELQNIVTLKVTFTKSSLELTTSMSQSSKGNGGTNTIANGKYEAIKLNGGLFQ